MNFKRSKVTVKRTFVLFFNKINLLIKNFHPYQLTIVNKHKITLKDVETGYRTDVIGLSGTRS